MLKAEECYSFYTIQKWFWQHGIVASFTPELFGPPPRLVAPRRVRAAARGVAPWLREVERKIGTVIE